MLYIDDETRSNISRYVVNTGDLIVSVVGTIGLTAYIGKTLGSVEKVGVAPDPKRVGPASWNLEYG